MKTVSYFSKSIVHELRTPLSTIKGFASIARGKLADDKKLVRYMDGVIKEADRVIRITSYNVCYTKLLRKKFMIWLLLVEDQRVLPQSYNFV